MKKKIAIFVLLLFLVCGCGKTNDKTSLSYEITIKDSENILTTTEVKKGELLEQPEDPTKEGYIFIRWVSNGETFDFSKPVSEDLTLEAEWYKINEDDENTVYVIKFDSEGGTTIENQIVIEGNTIIKPNDPVKDGYTFIAWGINGVDYDFNEKVNDNIILTAIWKNNNISSSDENISLAAPRLSSPSGDKGSADLSVIYAGDYDIKEDKSNIKSLNIDGWELYEKNGDSYNKIDENSTFDSIKVTIDLGKTRTFVARVYKNNNGTKVYSDYSNELSFSNKLSTPKLVTPSGDDTGCEFSISYDGSYESFPSYLAGWEIYEKIDGKYKLFKSGTSFKNFGSITYTAGETRIFKCRVYVLNSNNDKVYSSYSTEKSFSLDLDTPKLVTPAGDDSGCEFSISYDDNYESFPSYLAGWEIYEKVNGSYQLFKSGTSFKDFGSITYTAGETRVFRCRVYALNSKSEKVYSNYSSDLTISSKYSILTPELVTPAGDDTGCEFSISYGGSYESFPSYLSGWEIYEKVNGNYELFKSGTSFKNFGSITYTVGETRTFKCRIYVLNSKKEKIYSNYSAEKTFSLNLLTPSLAVPSGDENYFGLGISYDGSYEYRPSYLKGYEIYEKVNGSYQLFKSGTNFSDIGSVKVDAGETRIFRCRVYALNSKNEKVYSNYSNDKVLSFNLSTPSIEIPFGDENYFGLDISYDGSYEYRPSYLNGYEIYEKVNGSYQLFKSGTNFADIGSVKVDVGGTRIFRCRVYSLNSKGEKVFSNYSTDKILSFNLSTPKLVTPSGDGTYYYEFNISYDDSYEYRPSYLSGWEIYEKVNGSYQLFKSGTTFTGMGSITLNSNETRTFRCRVYALNSNNEKEYSEYSNDLVLTNN